MENGEVKIKFYNLGSEKINLIKKKNEDDLNFSKAFFSSSKLDNAMIKVIQKDIDSLETRMNKIIFEYKTKLDEIGIDNNINSKYSISEINKVIDLPDKLIEDLLLYKNNNKIGVFSADKKNKKERKKLIDNLIEYLNKSKIEIISMNDEYIKLYNRKKNLSLNDDFSIEDIEEENPLERTINFYVSKKEEANI